MYTLVYFYFCPEQKICSQPLNVGKCRFHNYMWFFNKNTNACEQFEFKGLNGNDNRFLTKEDCQQACPAKR